MQINKLGLDLIKIFEGLELEAYVDPVGVLTIGYGHTGDVRQDMAITENDAENLLTRDIERFETAIRRAVKVQLNENEFSALVSLAFNIGADAFENSTSVRRLNNGDRLGAAEAIEWWNKGRIGGRLRTLPGLARRRSAEKALFLKPAPGPAPSMPEVSLEENTRLPPSHEESGRRDRLGESRTLQGAGATAAAGGSAAAAAALEKGADPAAQQSPQVERILHLIHSIPDWAYWALAAISIVASIYVVWARIDDWRAHRR